MRPDSSDLILEVESDLYDASDSGWLREVDSLGDQLEREAAAVRRTTSPAIGEKGVATELIVNIAGSGTGEIAATAILGWLAGYRDRRIKIRRRDAREGVVGGEAVTVQSMSLDAAAIRQLAAQLEQLAQEPPVSAAQRRDTASG